MIVAWRIAHLMRMGRTCPDLDVALFFDPDEIHGAHLLLKKRRPSKPLGLNEMVRLVARCGGFLPARVTANRAKDDMASSGARHDGSGNSTRTALRSRVVRDVCNEVYVAS